MSVLPYDDGRSIDVSAVVDGRKSEAPISSEDTDNILLRAALLRAPNPAERLIELAQRGAAAERPR